MTQGFAGPPPTFAYPHQPKKKKQFTAKEIIMLFKDYQNFVTQRIHSNAKINLKGILQQVMKDEFNIAPEQLEECLEELKIVIRED